jgi:hypothetical protein
MERDRKSIGLTPETQAALAQLEEHGWFAEKEDIAKFCMAYAIRANVPQGATTGTDTRWAAGNFDDTGEIRALLEALYPACETPVRLMEHFVNEGLRIVASRVRSDFASPADLMD